jgi:3-phenylpropionate/trans-cinnamate dioxygenase ferredoxin subunit
MSEFVKVGKTGDLASGKGVRVEAGGKKIALFNVDGTYYAIDDGCTHRGGSLSGGSLSGCEVTCPLHGAVFDLKTGNTQGPPAPRGVSTYKVRVSGDSIEVEA